jgi:hypothetical protein
VDLRLSLIGDWPLFTLGLLKSPAAPLRPSRRYAPPASTRRPWDALFYEVYDAEGAAILARAS